MFLMQIKHSEHDDFSVCSLNANPFYHGLMSEELYHRKHFQNYFFPSLQILIFKNEEY